MTPATDADWCRICGLHRARYDDGQVCPVCAPVVAVKPPTPPSPAFWWEWGR
jgi:hypothetical protein